MFLLDTNVVSELRRGERADRNVAQWVARHPSASFFVSVITLLEIEQGVLLVERRDPRQGQALRSWLNGHVLPAFAGRMLDVTTEVALECARLNTATPRPYRDSLIAATAVVSGMTVVTRDTSPFAAMGVPFINPWLP